MASPLSDKALRFLQAVTLWETKVLPFVQRLQGRRMANRVMEELGEVRRATARMAICATELAVPSDPDAAEAALRLVLVRLRETGALSWSRCAEIFNDVAGSVPPPRH